MRLKSESEKKSKESEIKKEIWDKGHNSENKKRHNYKKKFRDMSSKLKLLGKRTELLV